MYYEYENLIYDTGLFYSRLPTPFLSYVDLV